MKKSLTIAIMAFLFGTNLAVAVPSLNSYPTANATIYLDFDGHDVNSSVELRNSFHMSSCIND